MDENTNRGKKEKLEIICKKGNDMNELTNLLNRVCTIQNILLYLVGINLLAFLAMWIDKRKAQYGKWRIKEMTLLILALLGGTIGGIVGMYTFHHKTKKPQFFIGFPVILICQIVCLIMQWI